MFAASTPGTEFATERKKEDAKEKKGRREEGRIHRFVASQHHFPLLWLPVGNLPSGCSVMVLGMIGPPLGGSLIGPQTSQYPNTLTAHWFRDGRIAQSETFSEFRERQASFFFRRYERYFFFLVRRNKDECSPGGGWPHLVLQREKVPENEANI